MSHVRGLRRIPLSIIRVWCPDQGGEFLCGRHSRAPARGRSCAVADPAQSPTEGSRTGEQTVYPSRTAFTPLHGGAPAVRAAVRKLLADETPPFNGAVPTDGLREFHASGRTLRCRRSR